VSSEDGGSGKQRLGRGLSSLLGEDEGEQGSTDRLRQSRTVPIEQVTPGRFQPRRRFDDDGLSSLAESIREKGVLQPILVRRADDHDGAYEIIAGERRWRAAQRAQLHEIPVLVRTFEDNEALEIALIENIQRQDLTPLEEAEGYQRLIDDHGHTQEVIAQTVGKSRSHVANTLRLLSLPDGVRMLVDSGALTAGHARALLMAEDPGGLAHKVVAEGLSVRATEKLAKKPTTESGKTSRVGGGAAKDPDTLVLESDLTRELGLKVDIRHHENVGTLTLHFDTLDQFDLILGRLSQQPAFVPPFMDPVGEEDTDDLDSASDLEMASVKSSDLPQ
jgi:ParB family chromosome partitioning protein